MKMKLVAKFNFCSIAFRPICQLDSFPRFHTTHKMKTDRRITNGKQCCMNVKEKNQRINQRDINERNANESLENAYR